MDLLGRLTVFSVTRLHTPGVTERQGVRMCDRVSTDRDDATIPTDRPHFEWNAGVGAPLLRIVFMAGSRGVSKSVPRKASSDVQYGSDPLSGQTTLASVVGIGSYPDVACLNWRGEPDHAL